MRKAAQPLTVAALAIALAGLLSVSLADARAEGESAYSKAQTFNGALRFLRVDRGYEIVEKDTDAAYILFRYQPPGRHGDPTHGSVEIIEVRQQVKVYVQLPKMPGYHETVLRDALLKKLRDEYGTPPPRKQAPRRPRDAGAD